MMNTNMLSGALRGVGMIGFVALMTGARGGCGTYDSTDPAPDVTGQWLVDYANTMEVDVNLGGTHYRRTISASGGMVEIDHGGVPIYFDIDCARADVVCPSETWPDSVDIDQRDDTYRHRMWVTIPTQRCAGREVAPDPAECGEGTINPECEPVCDGEVITEPRDAFGLIRENGTGFDLLLGGGVVSNGLNCAMLAVSHAEADFTNTGNAASDDWETVAMRNGRVVTGFAGGCLWVADSNMDGALEAAIVGATVEISTGFEAVRAE